jgi:hypothetical protein
MSNFFFFYFTNALRVNLGNIGIESATVTIYTLDGILAMSEEISADTSLDVSGLSNGTYILTLKGEGVISAEKLIIKK